MNESNTVLKARVEVTSTEFRGGEGYLFFLSNFWFHLVSFLSITKPYRVKELCLLKSA